MKLNTKQLWFVAAFAALGLAALQLPITHLAASRAQFTVFDASAPAIAGLIGAIPGLIAVALAEVINWGMHGFKVADVGSIIRLFPILMGVLYFGRRTSLNYLVPAVAIVLFIADPIGRSAWYFSLFWLIPIVMYFFSERSVFARALGATFAAHSVGGALYAWFVHLPKAVWVGLIPIVIIERFLFAAGITATYLLGVAVKKAWQSKRAALPAQN